MDYWLDNSQKLDSTTNKVRYSTAMDMYDKVYKIVAPKKAKLDAAEREFAEMMEMLKAKRSEVERLEAQLADLNEKLDEAVKKQKDLQDSVDLCNNKLIRAQKLIGGLGKLRSQSKFWFNNPKTQRWGENQMDCLC